MTAIEPVDIGLIIAGIVLVFALSVLALRIALKANFVSRLSCGLLVILGIIFIIYLIRNLREIEPEDWSQLLLVLGLVSVTGLLGLYAAGQARASVKMAEEMKEQRVTVSRPVVVQKAVHEKDIYEGSTKDYFSHFEAYNKGNGPAIEVEISLLDNDKNLIESHRKSFLGAGEPPIEFRPTSLATRRENSTCYLVCEYQSILSSGPRKMWYQTWLPFKPSKSSEKDKIYVVAGELEFKEATEEERIDAFSSRSKPK